MLRIGNILQGILVLHVDDAPNEGNGDEYEKTMDQILKTFEIKNDKRKKGNFSFSDIRLLNKQMEQFS